MKRLSFLASAALVSALVTVGCGDSTETETVNADAVAHGQALFSDPVAAGTEVNRFACATCHLAEDTPSDTRVRTGAVLAGALERPHYWGGQELELLRSINACRQYFMGQVNAWTADDPLAEALYAYLASLPATYPEAVPFSVVVSVKDLPAGDGTHGQEVYGRACAYCHGAIHTGEGRLTPIASILPDEPLAEHEADGFDADEQRLIFVEKVRHGGFYGYGGNMPPFSSEVLSDADLSDVLSYLQLY